MRVRIGRSWSRNRSAIPPRRSTASSSSKAIGSSDTLPAGHHERHADVGEQQVVQRRVREHHAELARARRDGRPRRRRAGPPRREHDRPLARAQQRAPPPARARPAPPPRPRRAPSARTACPRGACAPAAPPTARSSAAHARQMIPAEPLDRDDPAARSSAATPPRRPRRVSTVVEPRRGVRPLGAASEAWGRSRGRRSAGRGSGGRRGPRTRRGRRRTSRSRPSSCSAGRTGCRARS